MRQLQTEVRRRSNAPLVGLFGKPDAEALQNPIAYSLDGQRERSDGFNGGDHKAVIACVVPETDLTTGSRARDGVANERRFEHSPRRHDWELADALLVELANLLIGLGLPLGKR